ncbi:NAD(P)H-flavin reductase [Corallincola luteus]|uniref:NAD(P)H-flavin reductase n=3 Tax=Corallincola TaxID=1775176 RepID=A0A368N8F2_9GAMM|nr:NAD(P)H-flavin reductase [Corallincola holothuriorum]TAA41121.1 NAD(P)H-flavin reductase [Corallincola spongiicola]TCI02773.1 NAD(P)H-flavin reductase [Corallincola luteus]
MLQCKVETVTPLTEFVYRVKLRCQTPVEFAAGQYLQLCITERDKRPFSIASVPGDNVIELHIGASTRDGKAMEVIHFLQVNRDIQVELPLGDAQLRQPLARPIILVIGGTGFSYARSIVGELLKQPLSQPVYLYWGGRDRRSLYLAPLAQQWAQQTPHFHFIPVLENPPSGWQGKQGKVHEAVLEDFVSLDSYDVYVAGPFEMAGVVRAAFARQGLHPDHLYGDAYAFI